MGIFLIHLHVCKYFCNVLIACKLAGIKENWRQIIRFNVLQSYQFIICQTSLSLVIILHISMFLFYFYFYAFFIPFEVLFRTSLCWHHFLTWNLFLSFLISIAFYISFFNKLISPSISFTIISLCPKLQKLNKWKGDNGKTIKRCKQNFTKLLIKRVWKINLF